MIVIVCLFTHTHACYLNLCFWEMVGWFDWCYHIGLITNMHLKGYWTWKVLKDITKFCGSKWLALSNQSVLGSARDCHYWSFWSQSLILWLVSTDDSQMTWSAWLVSDIMQFVLWCFRHHERCVCINSFICDMHISYNLIWKHESYYQEHKCNCQRKHGFQKQLLLVIPAASLCALTLFFPNLCLALF